MKTKIIQPNQSSTVPDILTCMLKDTTSEHKTHIFDLKCKICTGKQLFLDFFCIADIGHLFTYKGDRVILFFSKVKYQLLMKRNP